MSENMTHARDGVDRPGRTRGEDPSTQQFTFARVEVELVCLLQLLLLLAPPALPAHRGKQYCYRMNKSVSRRIGVWASLANETSTLCMREALEPASRCARVCAATAGPGQLAATAKYRRSTRSTPA